MTETYRELKDQIEELTDRAEVARQAELNRVIMEIRELVRDFGLSPRDIFGTGTSKPRRQLPEVKYRDPETGETWCGKGRPPRWLMGKNRDQFLVTGRVGGQGRASTSNVGKRVDAPSGCSAFDRPGSLRNGVAPGPRELNDSASAFRSASIFESGESSCAHAAFGSDVSSPTSGMEAMVKTLLGHAGS
ncbi:H-NS family nucleoid-associated regulatory protein [Burkholderia territorii]|uniref:H-NS histone family protein n=1 Tax=Burkholderia territorii TaxID=1503055 RepID=UPI0009BEDCFC|nr:H-NS histone family protein [Burkholderia territorii]